MVGAVLVVIAVVIVLPIAFMMLGAAVSALLGFFLHREGELAHEGSELIDTNY